jgi:biotin carboxylase
MKRILTVGGRSHVVERARELGAEVLNIQKPGMQEEAALRAANWTILLDYENDPALLPMVRAFHAACELHAVISLTEFGLLPAAKLGAALSLPGMPSPEIVTLTRDKYLMRNFLRHTAMPPVAAAIGSRPEDVRGFADAHGYPVICKPRDGAGSADVFSIDGPEALSKLATGQEFLMEEFLAGPTLSIDAFSFNGRHVVFGINEECCDPAACQNPFLEVAHLLPAPLQAHEAEKIVGFVQEFLTLLGITDGPTHTEIILTKTGPRIIETHTRYGGDGIPAMIRLLTGEDLLTYTLAWPLGLVEQVPESVTPAGGAAVQFFLPPSGILKSVIGAEYWRGEPGVHQVELNVKPGSRILPPLKSEHRAGFVMAQGKTAAAAAALCRLVVDGVRFDVASDAS